MHLFQHLPGQENKMFLTKKSYGHDGSAMAVSVSPDGTHVASAGGDKLILLWNTSLDMLCVIFGHSRFLLVWIKNNLGAFTLVYWVWAGLELWKAGLSRLFLFTSFLKLQSIFNILIPTLILSRYVTCLSFSWCGKYLASGSNDKSIKVWASSKTSSGNPVHSINDSRSENLFQLRLSKLNQKCLLKLQGSAIEMRFMWMEWLPHL